MGGSYSCWTSRSSTECGPRVFELEYRVGFIVHIPGAQEESHAKVQKLIDARCISFCESGPCVCNDGYMLVLTAVVIVLRG